MNFLKGLLDWFKPVEIEQKQGSVMVFTGNKSPQWLPVSYRDFARGAYGDNEVVYACIRKIIKSFAEAPLRVFNEKDDIEIENHPGRLLVKHPNPFLSEYGLWEESQLTFQIAGNLFIEKIRSASSKVVELWVLRPDRIKIIPDPEEFIGGYMFRIGSRERFIPPENMIHIKYTDPLNDYWGQSPILAALRAIATDNEATDFTKITLENKGVNPGIVVTVDSKTTLTKDAVRLLGSTWSANYGKNKQGKPLFLQRGMDVKTIGLNMNELALPDITSIKETRIAAALDVPPIVINLKSGLDRSTFSNYAEAVKWFYLNTIIPLQDQIAKELNLKLMPDVGNPGDVFRFDNSDVAALGFVRDQNEKEAVEGFEAGLYTRNEARTKIGLEATPSGDIFVQPLNLISIPLKGTAPDPTEDSNAKKLMEFKQSPGALQVGLLESAIGRRAEAELFLKKLERWAKSELKLEAEEILRIVKANVAKSIEVKLDPAELTAVMQQISLAGIGWNKRIGDDGVPILAQMLSTAAEGAAVELGVAFDISSAEAQAFIQTYGFKFAQGLTATSIDDVREVMLRSRKEGLSLAEIEAALAEKFAGWQGVRANAIARTETIRAANKGAEQVYKTAGIVEKQWLAAGDACPYCAALDGKIVGVEEDYFKVGDSFQPVPGDSADDPIRPLSIKYEDVGVPPLHVNCRCVIIPVIN